MKITVIGSGFGALTAIRTLRKLDSQVEITVIAPQPVFQFFPSLIWVPAGLRSREDLMIDIKPLLKRLNVKFHAGSVTGIEADGRQVVTDNGSVLNDGLIIASGGRFIKKLPGIEHAITLCEGIDAAEQIRDRLAAMEGGVIAVGFGGNPNEPSAVRGGPMFELLFGLDRLLRQQGRRSQFKLVFFNPMLRPGNRLGEATVDRLLKQMQKLDIETHLGAKPQRFEADKVVTEKEEFVTDLILFMPGMTGPAWAADGPLPLSPGGMIQGDVHARVPGFERVYVVGDSGSYPAPEWAPKQAHMADLMAAAASENLLAEFSGKPANRTFKWELLCMIDMLDRAILVFRTEKRQLVTPSFRLLHWTKRFFEWWYLRSIR